MQAGPARARDAAQTVNHRGPGDSEVPTYADVWRLFRRSALRGRPAAGPRSLPRV